MNRGMLLGLAIGLAISCGASDAEEFRLQGEYWGNTSAPDGWIDSHGQFGRTPTDTDDAKATALCEGGSPCADVRLQDVGTKGPVITKVLSFDGSGRRLYIGVGGELWATGASQTSGLTFSGGQLTTSSTFTIGTMTVEDAGSTARSAMTAPNSAQFVLLGDTAVQGGLDLKATAGEVQNKGTLTQSGNGNMALYFGFDFRNLFGGVVDFQNDNGIAVKEPAYGVAGQTPILFHNEAGATLKKTAGTSTSVIEAPIVNAGTVSATNGQLNLAGGGTHANGSHFESIGPGVVALLGSHAITGAVTTTGDGSVYVGDFGMAGSLTIASGGTLSNGGRLFQNDTLTVEAGGKLDNTQDGQVYMSGTTKVEAGGKLGNSGTVQLTGTLVNSGDVTVKSGGLVTGSGKYTQEAGTTDITGSFGLDDGTYDQHGGTTTIRAGANLVLGKYDPSTGVDNWIGGHYVQTGGTTTVNGNLDSDSVRLEGGTLNGSGTIYGNVDVDTSVSCCGTVTINPGNSPGLLTVEGDFLASGALLTVFNIEIGGYNPGIDFDQILVSGNAEIQNAQVNFMFINGFVPKEDSYFRWLMGYGNVSLVDLVFTSNIEGLLGILDESGGFLVKYVPDGGGGGGGPGSPVPEPGSLVLLGLGLAAMRLGRRRATV